MAITKAQAEAYLNAVERDNNNAPRPCPDLAEWIAECRAQLSQPEWELDLIGCFDDDEWRAGSVIECGDGQSAVVVYGDGQRGVVMLSDGLYHPVHGDPSDEWRVVSENERGFDTEAEARAELEE